MKQPMKTIHLLHNPKAGDKEHSELDLIKLIEANGFKCTYSSTKEKGWKDIDPEADFLAVAGGDGTVRKVGVAMLQGEGGGKKHLPIALLPKGTANNIGKSLEISGEEKDIIASWKKENVRKFDVGKISGFTETMYFLEGFGFGVFPKLMNDMRDGADKKDVSPEERIDNALHVLHDIIDNYKAKPCQLLIDGVDHSGNFLLIEVMNTPSLGPNLDLNPLANTNDGELEVILIAENQREKFATYIWDKMKDGNTPFSFSTLKAKEITLTWEGVHAHVDDEVIKDVKGIVFEIKVKEHAIEFYVPEKQGGVDKD
jgi:diacylglycerol kinase (ATP)